MVSLFGMAIAFGFMIAIGVKGSLDARFFYTHEEAHAWYHSLDAHIRANYLLTEYFDLIFIFCYSSAVWILLKKRLAFVPGVLDLIETLLIIWKMKSHTTFFPYLGFITSLKWVSGGVLIIVLMLRFLRKKP